MIRTYSPDICVGDPASVQGLFLLFCNVMEEDSVDYQDFTKKIYRKTGIDLSLYKETQMKRRLTSFYQKHGLRSFAELYLAIADDRKLYADFLDRITINVSEFFRNRKRWEFLQNHILPELLQKNRRLKIWSAACSEGQEPYTLAMILNECTDLRHVQILATDIDERALQKAENGIYQERALQEVPESLVKKYFVKTNEGYEICKRLKEAVIFKKHNLLGDPYPYHFDLIVCRNVLIYFTEEAKEQIYRRFNESLHMGGILFVGSTEQIFYPAQYGFSQVDTFFYKKVTNISSLASQRS